MVGPRNTKGLTKADVSFAKEREFTSAQRDLETRKGSEERKTFPTLAEW
jgi:hypothetical protein